MATDRLTAAMSHIESSVTGATTVIESMTRFIAGITPLMRQLKDSPDKIESLATALDKSVATITQAMVANTIAEGQEQPSTPTPSTPAVPSVPGEAGVSPVDANVDASDTEGDTLEDDAEDATDMEDDTI